MRKVLFLSALLISTLTLTSCEFYTGGAKHYEVTSDIDSGIQAVKSYNIKLLALTCGVWSGRMFTALMVSLCTT